MVSPGLSVVPTAEKLQVEAALQDGRLITGTGAVLPAGSVIVTVLVTGCETAPHSSFAVSVTV